MHPPQGRPHRTHVTDFATDLSPAARALWGKWGRDGSNHLPLFQHMADTAAVARYLWENWLASQVKDQMVADLRVSETIAGAIISFLAGAHDIGKASPTFAAQAAGLIPKMKAQGLRFPEQMERVDHQLASHLVLHRWLTSIGFTRAAATTHAVIVGGHHGQPPTDQQLLAASARPELTGMNDDAWTAAQDNILRELARSTGFDKAAKRITGDPLAERVQVLTTSLVILSDWAASNTRMFPVGSYYRPGEKRTERALARLAAQLGRGWTPADFDGDPVALYAAKQLMPAGATPHPAQVAAVEAARKVHGPGLLIIEAPPGEGKTEAALAAAEILGEKTGANGIYMGLPTQATGGRMFGRFVEWQAQLASGNPTTVALAHANYGQDAEYREIADNGLGDLKVSSWTSKSSKTRSMATFAVGTIDQVLFATLKASHVALRHLAFAGKVVILDEVHAYDAYMSVYLDAALHWLGSYGAPVIILSATLPPSRRAEMVAAYRHGLTGRPEAVSSLPAWQQRRVSATTAAPYQHIADATGYPLVVRADKHGSEAVVVPPGSRRTRITIDPFPNDLPGIAAEIRKVVTAGGCVGIIKNTVRGAQEMMDHLPALVPEATFELAHSRFVREDRAANDDRLGDTLGKNRTDGLKPKVEVDRPTGHVVIGTQVLEQSLDIDFDLLVTDLAPVDLLFQRMGRLHRHSGRKRPANARYARCLIIGVTDWHADPPTYPEASTYVYPKALLTRTAALILERRRTRKTIRVPDDIAPWVRAVYGTALLGPRSWRESLEEQDAEYAAKIADQKTRASLYVLDEPGRDRGDLIGWLERKNPDEDVEAAASVRDGIDGMEIALLIPGSDGRLHSLPWLERAKNTVSLTSRPETDDVDTVTATSVRLPGSATPNPLPEPCEAWAHTAIQGITPIVFAQHTAAEYRAVVGDVTLRYTRELGLKARRSTATT